MNATTISDGRLLSWLESDPGRLERYLAEHPAAADRLDRLTEWDDTVRSGLRSLLSVPDGLRERLAAAGVTRPLKSEVAGVVMDLFSLPWHVTQALAAVEGAEDVWG